MDSYKEFAIAIQEKNKDGVIKLLTSDDSKPYLLVLLFNNTSIIDHAFKYYDKDIIKILMRYMLDNKLLNFSKYIIISLFNRKFEIIIKLLNFSEITESITDFNILIDIIRVYSAYNGSDKVFKLLIEKCENLDPSYGNNLLLLYLFDKHYIKLINVLLNDERVIKKLKYSDIPKDYIQLLFNKFNVETEKELETALQLI
jgi:hypothetical protein